MSNELGEFLRARRADPRLTPTERPGSRRRRTGLRREEVATAAGISIDYYIRLEQGRERRPSDSVVDALARALDLAPDATAHLYRLRGNAQAERAPEALASAGVVARMTALVAALRPNPAYVLTPLSTMVAANPEGLALYDGFAELAWEERNTCRYLLTDRRARQTFLDWEDLARTAVAQLRAAHAGNLRSPQLLALVAQLSAASPLFEQWWHAHLVQRRRSSTQRLLSPGGVVVTRDYEVLHLPDEQLRLTIWLDSQP